MHVAYARRERGREGGREGGEGGREGREGGREGEREGRERGREGGREKEGGRLGGCGGYLLVCKALYLSIRERTSVHLCCLPPQREAYHHSHTQDAEGGHIQPPPLPLSSSLSSSLSLLHSCKNRVNVHVRPCGRGLRTIRIRIGTTAPRWFNPLYTLSSYY